MLDTPQVASSSLPEGTQSYDYTDVSFIYDATQLGTPLADPPGIIGTFAQLHTPISLQSVQFLGEATGFYALTIRLPKGEKHRYRFHVNGAYIPDPVNPCRVTSEGQFVLTEEESRFKGMPAEVQNIYDGKRIWSLFWTYEYLQPIVFESWELRLLYRLTEEILPFKAKDVKNFLVRFYNDLSKTEQRKASQLEESVGQVNYIDKLMAGRERQFLVSYKICLDIIDKLLRQRNTVLEPAVLPQSNYTDLYNEMAASSNHNENHIQGWDYERYGNPRYFLTLLRRHTVTGAFSHPKYSGNVGAAAWAYLSETYKDAEGNTLFDWRPALELPLGTNEEYQG